LPHHDADRLAVDLKPAGVLAGTCYACDPPHPLVGDPEQHLIEVEAGITCPTHEAGAVR
jgi:hypothetical protein